MAEDPTAARAATSGADEQCFFDLTASLLGREVPATLHIAIVGPNKTVVFEGFRHFPATRVVLLHTEAETKRARKMRETFEGAGIQATLQPAGDEPYMGILRALNSVIHEARVAYHDILVNVASGTSADGCAATTSAYLHGLKAFHVQRESAHLLPILPVSQRDALSEADVRLLLQLTSSPRSVRAVAKASRTSEAEVRAHIAGEPGHKGLRGLGLVEVVWRFGQARFRLSPAGRTLVASGALTSDSPTV